MKNLPRALRTIALLAGAIALGVLFNRSVIPFFSHDVTVWVIPGVEGRGCEGGFGTTTLRFGQPVMGSCGVHKSSCDQISFKSETFALLCKCR